MAMTKEELPAIASSLSPADKYRNEWNNLVSFVETNFDGLQDFAFRGELKVSKFRSVCWSLLLKVINDTSCHWIEQKQQQRLKYKQLKEEFACNPHKELMPNDNPLSQSKQSAWNQYFGDQELCSVIRQDVTRTFPGVDFFRKPFIQEAMINVLFYYAREHPYMCYRQGMHEILAPILFVLHCDHQALQHFIEVSTYINNVLLEVLNPSYLEADAFCIFSRLMSSIESYYRIANLLPTSEGYFPVQTEPCDDNVTTEIEVIRQLHFIRDKILAKEDLHLHNHLLKLDIPLHLFGIRWLRLLFGREFALQDLLMLWDAIFADSDRFELPNYILVAMMIRIRDKLLLSDYTTCLTHLMRYPTSVDSNLILRHALYMYMPKKYERPSNAFVYVTPSTSGSVIARNTTTAAHMTELPRQHSLKRPSNFSKHLEKGEQRGRSLSLSGEKNLQIDLIANAKINAVQSTTAKTAAQLATHTAYQGSDVAIIDGYREDSPQVLRLQLQNAQSIMAITRLKLQKYLIHLRSHIRSEELSQTLDGIEELCAFLEVKNPIMPLTMHRDRVDPALEADEEKRSFAAKEKQWIFTKTSLPSKLKETQNQGKKSTEVNLTNNASPPSTGDNKQLQSQSSTETNLSLDVNISTEECNPSIVSSSIKNCGTRYEIPDNSYLSSRSKTLSGRRDVELKIFRTSDLNTGEDAEGIPDPDPIGLHT